MEYEEFDMEERKCCNINLKYLPIKAHFFFLFGGLAGTIPFMQVFAKDLGINATAVGLIYTIVPFCVFLAKPLFGYLTDLFRNIKVILMILVSVTALAFFAVLFVPPLANQNESIQVTALCTSQDNEFIIEPSSNDSQCFQTMINKEFKCELNSNCIGKGNLVGILNISTSISRKENISFLFTFNSREDFPSKQICDCIRTNYSQLNCEGDISKCTSVQNTESESVYRTSTFWLFSFLAIIAGTGSATSFCLTDAACYEVLGQNPQLYGRQRLWATVCWGIITFLAGYLNDIATYASGETSYSPGFYLMVAFIIVDLVILSRTNLVKGNISSNICKDIGKIYTSWRTVIFSLGVYISGALTGLIWNYEFWYLQDLGANQTLLGLVVAVQCLVAELPFFFFSEWFILKLGHFYCLIGVFFAFALRTLFYVLITNPWIVLPIEALHGITYAIFYTAMTSYAAEYAPPGTEATLLGVLGGVFEGLGVATGSLLGGLGFDQIGGNRTFFAASIISFICVPFFTIAYHFIKRSSANLEVTRSLKDNLTTYGANSHNGF